MRHLKLLLLIILAVGVATSSYASPILNISGDKFEDLTDNSVFAYYQNSGTWLFTAKGNNDGNNLSDVQQLVRNAMKDQDLVLTITNVAYTSYDNNGTIVTDAEGTQSGTWSVTAPSNGTIDFYAVKASNFFAMYAVAPAEGTGSWSTYGLWKDGYTGTGHAISHFTGYNPGTTYVPEPGMLLLFGSGLLGLGLFGRKKFRN